MSARSLFDAVIEPGFRNPNFFEGRLLTAADLRDDQKAHRERQRLLGRAIGAGVVEGLAVALEPALTDGVKKTVTIGKGYALNGEGELLWLKQDLTVDVVPPTVMPEPPATLFKRCETATPTPTIPVGVGLYILVMSPASGYRERAPKSGLGSEGRIIGCGDRYGVDGVRFRLEPLQPAVVSGADAALKAELTALLNATGDPAKRSLLRNLVAHLCFGTPELAAFPADPFAREEGASAFLSYGALDDLRSLERLTDCDVPLALFLWTASGIAFLDLWSVRRRPVPPPRTPDWPLLAGERSMIEGEARLLQFQAHLASLVQELPNPPAIQARAFFRHLPPAGVLRLATLSMRGVQLASFFRGLVLRNPEPPVFAPGSAPIFIEGARLMALLKDSYAYPAADLDVSEFFWVHRVRQNALAAPATEQIVVFAAGQTPYRGNPRFDAARWDYSNYSSALLGPGGI